MNLIGRIFLFRIFLSADLESMKEQVVINGISGTKVSKRK